MLDGAKLDSMPRYYLHVHDETDTIDEEGADFPTDEFALGRGLREARELAGEDAKTGKLNLNHSIIIASEGGRIVGEIKFRDAVHIEGLV
ncbi:hypothetical protein G7A66_03415 [Altererythrobacter sp. SALINAS58]|uniref:DUF6894 family protein n=1 Tax=Alteripontixanthobacter muriae TaxID=2705546 RepID=UPI0015754015|nr:hypothetical protein [Alteripontixanthobacter muriae]NTZ42156.1 hypothetical protein [Alteripontixanthobacter muriae]